MTPPSIADLTEFELDALTELVNIGVGRAALSLRELVGEQVLLSAPVVQLVDRSGAVDILKQREPNRLVAVQQAFEGDINGRALLIFPERRSLELVRAVTGGDLPLEDIIELEHEALAETGNIILNGCLCTIANMLQRSLKMSLPEVIRGEGPEFFDHAPAASHDVVMFMYINFDVRGRDIRGYIAMLMDMPSLATLKSLLQQFIERTLSDAATATDAPA